MNKSDHHGRMGATAALLLRLRRRRRATVANLAAHCFSGCCPLGNIQNILARKLTFRSDYGLIATGVIAAISSVAFAIFMISEGSNPEMVKKGEIARFFARGLLAKSDKSPGSVNKPDTRPIRYRNIDYDVTGSISMHGPGVTGQKISPDSVIDGISTPVNASAYNTYVLRFPRRNGAPPEQSRFLRRTARHDATWCREGSVH